MAQAISKMETTAVEWLVKELKLEGYDYTISQAKALEKEQIIKAVDSNFSYDNNGYSTLGEQYYNETYNK